MRGWVPTIVAVFLVAGCSSPDPAADRAPTSGGTPTGPAALDSPRIVSAERIAAPDGVRAWDVRYRSESVAGAPIEVRGWIAIPDAPAGMPIMAWAHPTVGIADRCAPSTSGPGFTPFDVGRPLEAGWAVIATDFEGLGGPGLHPYLVGEAEARAIFDLARAVREMDSGVGSTLLLWGFSHGGHAVLAAGGLADDLGPEFDIAGIAGVAPTVDLIGWASTAIGTIEQAHIVGIVMALAATYELDVTEVLTPAAIEILDEAEASCSDPTFSTIAGMSGSSVFAADPATIDPWAGLLIDNSPELHPIEAPVLLVVGSEDRLWDVDDLDLIVDRMCGVGTPVATSIHLGEDHESIVAAAIATVTSFLQERLAGEPFETDC